MDNAPETVTNMKLGVVSWLRHLARSNETSPCKKVTFSKLEGSGRGGRPSPKCLGSAQNDLGVLGIRDWKTKALDRKLSVSFRVIASF